MEIKNPLAKSIVWIILLIWGVAVLYPLLWTLLDALKNNEQFFLNAPWALPKYPLLWSNFSYVWSKYNFSTYFLNSIIVTAGSTLLGMILAAMTAYILARYDFKGNKIIFTIYISSMMIPFALALIPLFFLLNDLQLINTWLGLILVYAALNLPFGIFLLVGFYKSLPKEIEEAAIIDGTSHYGTFFRVMLPLSQPGLITVMITNMLNNWNEYFLGVVLTNEPTKYTLPIGLAVMQAEMQYRVEWGPLFAGLLITTLPTLIVYIIFQRQIASGITAGAVK
ncbi:carbohydrate ABC transporter permease [Paenibacillus sp. CGMCC 1.16610]|uniref:Carbohydrate ABC transporter permease n=2 Tax=Paenibacillus TaxID=44249 RepID=A0ABU6D6K7_9BACL|nr:MULTISPECIES: carbohydrate ABC transporter permease [Paenibacillus]MBA2943806.1 carbohydrate ABC transporter permease [Paenibacillus sp. CGMCC 1.16610]MCY9662502.1 carbohydrate ABC transporter permease [Paenibacillus anseongense]MEB4793384.1 carbohydrate ABC transporter permease [Paenibacillus chondroitinus]MVQ37695.1 ABC transporter permease subunit [Paenibacillus anseongense]